MRLFFSFSFSCCFQYTRVLISNFIYAKGYDTIKMYIKEGGK